MIKADHKNWAQFVFNIYLKRLLHKNFSNFYLINSPPSIQDNGGLIITPNHFSWWDGFLIETIRQQFFKTRKLFILMLEEQLKRYWFFQKLGAYAVNLKNPKSIIETISYTKKIISPESIVVIYPQGEIQPFNHEIKFKKGLVKFISDLPLKSYVLPVAFNFQFAEEKKPDIYCRFGKPIDARVIQSDFHLYEKEFTDNLIHLKDEMLNKKNPINIFNKN